ncbi:hypothetical protein HOT75_gp006 [Gordonia phage Daredevil]|uniref:Uncharacterized protein n=1 Tax=Gordonia phage Daredevil TaxID=2283286 RepID=A0A345MIL3_9CAUD|nr:hypothetical protein HOT75_gp006 [Gordonia phage Daredevil]AXH70394.1 hypothetical protein SEA_DAREDEVIL_6 [Gordonia phage Daredevil]
MIKRHHYRLAEFDKDGICEDEARVELFNHLVQQGIDPEAITFHDADRALFKNGVISLDPEGAYVLVTASVRP